MLALLAFVCLPALAYGDSSGVQYEDAPPSATGNGPSKSSFEPPARSSSADGGSVASPSGGGSAGSVNTSAGNGQSKSGDGTAAAGGYERGTGQQQGSQANGTSGGSGADGRSLDPAGGKLASDSEDDGFPLVPVLIAIAVLAAASVAGLIAWQRRRRDGLPGEPVSSKAS